MFRGILDDCYQNRLDLFYIKGNQCFINYYKFEILQKSFNQMIIFDNIYHLKKQTLISYLASKWPDPQFKILQKYSVIFTDNLFLALQLFSSWHSTRADKQTTILIIFDTISLGERN